MTPVQRGFLGTLPPGHRDRLAAFARDVSIPAGTRIFEEGGVADRFWIIRSGGAALDVHIPGRRAAVVETLGEGDLLGWSWLFEPYRWHLGARARGTLLAAEFDAGRVRAGCARDPAFGLAITHGVAAVIARRLGATRARLLDLYGPPGTETGGAVG
ncbi:cyclic nucleotide-binding domain-containing protein [Kitasatospora sp. NPDC049258]|uniref:cyclic nucleotide-binding domain-containing protein n=1 Tax=Kitasatospora sp. NPDC049258 TaxID=3155394 RepID=UPI00342591BE